MDILGISKESAYRRMRGEIPFSFNEITLLSLDLEFSVDEVIGNNKYNRIFFDLISNSSMKPEESFLAMLQEYYKFTESVCKSENGEMIISINRLNPCLLMKSDALFKLFYYKWIHQTSNISVNRPFSETHITPEIQIIRNKFASLRETLTNVSYIIDRDVFSCIVREIQYFSSRKLITEEETIILKNDLKSLLRDMEDLMQKGYNEYGCTYNFYLSLLDVETNTTWASFDKNVTSLFWMYSVNPVIINNKEVSFTHKKWLESLKKYSVLITQSNEILQTKFIEKQQKFIENISDTLSYYE
jgi:hypothetical protein